MEISPEVMAEPESLPFISGIIDLEFFDVAIVVS